MVIKTAVTALSRKILKAKRELNKAKEQAEKNATAGRVARVKKKKDNLAELQNQTVAGQKIEKAAEDRKKESPEQISKRLREEKRIAGRKKRAAYRQGMKDKTPEDRKEIIKIRAEQKRDDIQDKLENLNIEQDRAYSLTEEGSELMNSSNPRDQDKLLDHIRKHKGRSKYIYVRLDAPLRAKGTKMTNKEMAESDMSAAEKIEQLTGRTPAPLTASQIKREIRNKGFTFAAGGKVKDDYKELRRGGLSRKRYQSTKKYGAKEHVYLGGGMVQDIVHFRKKRGR